VGSRRPETMVKRAREQALREKRKRPREQPGTPRPARPKPAPAPTLADLPGREVAKELGRRVRHRVGRVFGRG
jgi:hypothetical protein